MSDINYGTGHNMFWGGGNEEGYDGDVIYVCVLEEGGGGHCIYVGLAQT